MRPDLLTVTERVVSLRGQTALGTPPHDLLDRIDDALAEGYARALAGDAWSMLGEERLHELLSDTDAPLRERQIRALTSEHAGFERELVALRRQLAELRRDRDRLNAGRPARPVGST